ncbi:MAG: LppM family (lipo)protein, partial [Acidimicrobiia bacterium]
GLKNRIECVENLAMKRIVLLIGLALATTGCFRVEMDLTVTEEETVSGVIVMAMSESLLEMSGSSTDEVFEDTDVSELTEAGGEATVEPYEQDGFVGQTYTIEGAPLAAFTEDGILTRTGEGWELAMDVGETIGTEPSEMGEDQMIEGMFTGARYVIRMTIPGEVKDHNGTSQAGSRVEWAFQESELTDGTMPDVLTATWDDSGYASGTPGVTSSGGASLLFVGGAIIAALIGVGLFVVGRNKADEPVPVTPATATVGAPGMTPQADFRDNSDPIG